jgi:hypothetical protein
MNFADKLDECSDFSHIFDLVKEAVKTTINRRRSGLMLGLSDLPVYIGALHQIGSNFIIMNKKLLKEVLRTGDKKIINSYIFHVLLHEYIHSLGFTDEKMTEMLTHGISEKVLGLNHPATLISKNGIGSVLSNLNISQDEPETRDIEIIEYFESDNLNYFG